MSAIGPFMAPCLQAPEIYIPAPARVETPPPRIPDHCTSSHIASPSSNSPWHSAPFRVGSPISKCSVVIYPAVSISPPQAKKFKRTTTTTTSSQMSSISTSPSSSSSSSSSCSHTSHSSGSAKTWMKAARKHWNQAILHLDKLISNWALFDEEVILSLRRTFVTLDCHMKSLIGSTSEPLAKRYCSDAERLHRTVEAYARSTPEPSTHKADVLIFSALKHLFVNRKTSNQSLLLGIRFAAHILRSSASDAELLAWARFFHNNAVYDETALQLESAIAELHSLSNCAVQDTGSSAQNHPPNLAVHPLQSRFED